MSRELLPLGTVVYMKEGKIPVMIVMRQPIIDYQDQICYFDYAGINQVLGLDPNQIFYFNEENIRKVVYEGYRGESDSEILVALNEWVEKNTDIPKGKAL